MRVCQNQRVLSHAHIKENSHQKIKRHVNLRSLSPPNLVFEWKGWPYGSLKLPVKTVTGNSFDTGHQSCIRRTCQELSIGFTAASGPEVVAFLPGTEPVAAVQTPFSCTAAAASPCALLWARSKSLGVPVLAAFCYEKLSLQHLARAAPMTGPQWPDCINQMLGTWSLG